jgi:hypothetical protein
LGVSARQRCRRCFASCRFLEVIKGHCLVGEEIKGDECMQLWHCHCQCNGVAS